MRRQEVRLAIIDANASIERRPLRLDSQLLRASEHIAVIPANARACLFFRAIADTGGDLVVLPFCDRDANRYFLVHQHRFLERLDVRKLEQLESVQLALALPHRAASEPIVRLERQLPSDHVLTDRGEASDVDLTKVRQHAWRRVDDEAALPGAGVSLAQRHFRI